MPSLESASSASSYGHSGASSSGTHYGDPGASGSGVSYNMQPATPSAHMPTPFANQAAYALVHHEPAVPLAPPRQEQYSISRAAPVRKVLRHYVDKNGIVWVTLTFFGTDFAGAHFTYQWLEVWDVYKVIAYCIANGLAQLYLAE